MDRKPRRGIPSGLELLIWPALVRAPWLIDSVIFPGSAPDNHRRDGRERFDGRPGHRRR